MRLFLFLSCYNLYVSRDVDEINQTKIDRKNMFTIKAFYSPDRRRGHIYGLDQDGAIDREVFEAKSYLLARLNDNHAVVLFDSPHSSVQGQAHVGPNQAYWRVIIENSSGTNVEKMQLSPDNIDYVMF